MVMNLFKKKKDKKDKDKLAKLQKITPEIRDAVIARYFSKCQQKHSLQFFEWRKKRHLVKVKVSLSSVLTNHFSIEISGNINESEKENTTRWE